MTALPFISSDQELIAYIDRWVGYLEQEAYFEAFSFVDHDPVMGWTPILIERVIKSYGDASPSQRVTLDGKPTDITQRKKVTRWPDNRFKVVGAIWYDLNIDGFVSDLTAMFDIVLTENGVVLRLNDIHVM